MSKARFYQEFSNTPKIVYGIGCFEKSIDDIVNSGIRNAFLICDDEVKKDALLEGITDALTNKKIRICVVYVNSEKIAKIETLKDMKNSYRVNNCDGIIACGGYHVSNTAKAMKLWLSTQVARFEDIQGVNIAKQKVKIPFITIPTSVGLGNSVTKNVFVKDLNDKICEVISEYSLPNLCIIDSRFVSVNNLSAIITGTLNSFAHNIEEFVSTQSTVLTKSFNLIAIKEVRDNIHKIIADKEDTNAIMGLQMAGILAGIGYSNVEAGIAHAIAQAIARTGKVSNEVAMGIIFTQCMKFNLEQSKVDYEQILYYIVGDDKYASTPSEERANELIDTTQTMIDKLFKSNAIPLTLSEAGIGEEELDFIAEETMKSYAIITNPRMVSKEDVYTILRSVI